MAFFRLEKNTGYTVMSNHHLRNKGLSLKAKGLLSQMLSLPDDWDFTLNGLAYINKEKVDAIRTAVQELVSEGYIVRSRERDDKGMLRGTEYIIYETPHFAPDPPKLENPILDNPPKLENPTLDNPRLGNPRLENPILDNPTLENPTQPSKELTNKDKQSKEMKTSTVCLSVPSVSARVPSHEEYDDVTDMTDTAGGKNIDSDSIAPVMDSVSIDLSETDSDSVQVDPAATDMDAISSLSPAVRKQLEWDAVVRSPQKYGVSDVIAFNTLCEIVQQELQSPKLSYRIYGDVVQGPDLQNVFRSLTRSHLVHILQNVEQSKPEIRNPERYYIAALYRSVDTIEQMPVERKTATATPKGQFFACDQGRYDYAAIEAALREN